jgi:NTE family protein
MRGWALGGGGSKGGFQLGAMRLLHDRGLTPDVLAGTSVGSLNAFKYAEGEDASTPTQGLTGLEGIWSSLQTRDDVFAPQPWLAGIGSALRNVLENGAPFSSLGPDTSDDFIPLLSDWVWVANPADPNSGLNLLKDIQTAAQQTGIFTLDPIRRRVSAELDLGKVASWASGGRRVFAVVVALESGELRAVDESGAVYDRSLTRAPDRKAVPASCAGIKTKVDSATEALAQAIQEGREATDAAQRAAAGRAAAAARKELADAQAEYEACFAEALKSGGVPPLQVGVVDAIVASAAAPPGTPPESMGGETYVDGGVRALVPTEIVVAAGADEVYAMSCSPISSVASRPFDGWKIFDTASRSVNLQGEEIGFVDVSTALRPGVSLTVVAPDVEIHSGEVVDPGLTQINRDYGYMRAADALDGIDPGSDRWRLSTRIAQERFVAWAAEIWLEGWPNPTTPYLDPEPPNPAAQSEITLSKQRLQGLLDERTADGGAMPPDIYYWTTHSELHPGVAKGQSRLDAAIGSARIVGLPGIGKHNATIRIDVKRSSDHTEVPGADVTISLSSEPAPSANTKSFVIPVNVTKDKLGEYKMKTSVTGTASAPGYVTADIDMTID